ncbi:MAG: alanine racemase [Nitrospirae bacterium]|nr:alanine racemase [Nitrospirota bacterium]
MPQATKADKKEFFPTVAEIDLSALLHNLGEIRKWIGPERQIIAVVKADAYGHGAVRISQTLEEAGVSVLGVALVQEGIELRQGGVRLPILVMGSILKEQIPSLVDYRLTPVLFQSALIPLLEKEAESQGVTLPVHIKIDTGMGRLGILPEELITFIKKILRYKRIKIEGIMTHLADADRIGSKNLSGQIRLWEKILADLDAFHLNISQIHLANSAAIASLRNLKSNPVRPGLSLYGYSSIKKPPFSLEPVLTFKTRIVHLKTVPAGTPISYGGTFITPCQSTIATLPVGYADGYWRALSNCGKVLIHGKRVPVVGRVCMDMTMVDVTNITAPQIGDEAVLIGKQGKEFISAEEVAGWIGTIPYEVLCGIGKRVPRIYKDIS